MNTKKKTLFSNPYLQFTVLAALLCSVPFLVELGILPANFVTVFAGVMIYSIAALGLNILLGFSGLISLGTAGFMGLGAYLAAYFTQKMGIPFELSLIISVAITALLGVVIGLVSLKIEGLYLAIATLVVAEVLREIFIQFDAFTGGSSGATASYPSILFGVFKLKRTGTYVLITLILLAVIILMYNLLKGYIGRSFNAMRGSEHAARAMGVSIFKYRLISFTVASALAGLAGVLYAHIIRGVFPTTWNLNMSLDILAAVVIGGFRSIYGTVLGAFVVFGFNDLFIKQIPWMADYAYILKGVFTILIIMFYPGGLVRAFADIKTFIKKKIGKNKGV